MNLEQNSLTEFARAFLWVSNFETNGQSASGDQSLEEYNRRVERLRSAIQALPSHVFDEISAEDDAIYKEMPKPCVPTQPLPVNLPPIVALTEALLGTGQADTIRQASHAIRNGHVYVNGIRVANKDALLVLTGQTTLKYNDDERLVQPRT